jgi:hypothetical protein
MTSVTIDRFRRFETILHVLLDAASAELATNLAGLFIEGNSDKPNLIAWRSLAERYGQPRAGFQDILTEANAAARTGLDFP